MMGVSEIRGESARGVEASVQPSGYAPSRERRFPPPE